MRGNFLFLLIFAITLCIYPLYTTAQPRTFTHVEEQSSNYSPKEVARMIRLRVYDDGTIVARMVRKKEAATVNGVKTCFYEMLSFRIIHTNGTVDEKDINNEKLGIPSVNYCFLTISVEAQPIRFLDYFLIRKDQILITYVESTNPDDPSTFEDWGMIIDFNGNIYSKIFFGPRYVDPKTSKFVPGMEPKIELNVNVEKGFIRLYSVRGNIAHEEWQQYRVEPDGTLTKLTSDIVPTYSDALVGLQKSLVGRLMATVDGGYAILVGNSVNNLTSTAENPLLQQAQIRIVPIEYEQTATSPLLLYQSSLPNINFTSLDCDVAFVGIGQSCILTVIQRDLDGIAPPEPDKNFFVKVDFLSSGSPINFTVFNGIAPTNNLFPKWDVKSLPFGGFLVTNVIGPEQGKFNKRIYGYLFNGIDADPTPWELDEPTPANVEGIFEILPNNNTLLIPQFEGDSWSILVIDLPKFQADKDNGYNNLKVESTIPAISEPLDSKKPNISVNFYEPIDLSNGTLSIYQVVDNQQNLPIPNRANPMYQVVGDQIFILRQSIPGKKCSKENDGKTVIAETLDSTFSISKGNYFAMIDNEFVKDTIYNEPILGIRENIWSFNNVEIEDKFAPGTTGLLRLSSDGTIYFDSLSPTEQFDFYDSLKNELSFAVPIDFSRLTVNRRVQRDKELKDKRYLISIGIEQTKNLNEISVATAIALIDNMIKNKDQSPIGLGQVTKYLDESYGFMQSPNLWETYKTRLIGLFAVFVLFIVLFIIAQRRDKKARNIAIFQLGLIVADLLIDILFVSTNAQDIYALYIPSVLFITLPITINTSLAFYIITQENTKPEFYKWYRENGLVAILLTLLAGADIEALDILQSKLAGFKSFDAPFSDPAKSKIFWGAFLNIFTEDIPQVIIQIYYRTNSVTYDIVPLLTLISSSVNLTVNIVGRLYNATNRMRLHNIENYTTPNDEEEFGGLNNVSEIDVEKGGKEK